MARFPCRAAVRCRAWLDALEPRLMLSSDAFTETFEAPGVGQPARVSAESPLLTLQQIHVATGVDAAHVDYGLTGLGQTVVVIDSGIAYDHPALGGGFGSGFRVVGGRDFTEENDDNPYDDGPAGFHGTHVAGIIGSSDDTHRGVAPAVDLVALRIFNDRGRGKLDWLESSLQWVLENVAAFDHPITTVNLSLGTDWNELTLPEYATLEDELRELYDAGVFVAVAAGNRFDATHEGLSYPAVSPHVTPVASLDTAGHLSDFSQRYATVIAAPGEKITSTVPDYLEDFNGVTDDFYAASGTSMAAPYVAASSVLVREAMQRSGVSEITIDAIRNVLVETAELVFDPATGQSYRRLNVVAAIEQILGPSTENVIDLGVIDSPITYFTESPTGPTELQFISRYSGLVSVEVIRSATSPSWQSPGRLPQANTDRLILSVVGNQLVRTELPTGNAISELRVSPLLTQRGDLLVIEGTSGNDEILFDEAGRVTINRQRFSFTSGSIDQVAIGGGSGEDRLQLISRHDHSQVVLSPGQIQLTHPGFHLAGNNLERIEVLVHGAHTATTFYDSQGPDQFFARPTHSWMKNEQYLNYVKGSCTVTGWTSDARDRAVLYDSSAADVLVVDPRKARLRGPGYENQATGFQTLAVRAQGGGEDRATMNGATADDVLQPTHAVASMRGPEFLQDVYSSENTMVHGNGAIDAARLIDGPGADRFFSTSLATWMLGVGSSTFAEEFAQLVASSSEEFDSVFQFDSAGDDVLGMGPDNVAWDGAEFHFDLASFAQIVAQATKSRDRLAVDSVLSQAVRENDPGWAFNWGDLSLVAEGFELAS